MTEKACADSLQAVLLTTMYGSPSAVLFAAGDVTINDWTVLDGSVLNAPYIIIETADDFQVSDIQTGETETKWTIPFTLIGRWIDWSTSLILFRDHRQAIIDNLKDIDHYPAAHGALAVKIRGIRSRGAVGFMYPPYTPNPEEAMPNYITQELEIEVEEVTHY